MLGRFATLLFGVLAHFHNSGQPIVQQFLLARRNPLVCPGEVILRLSGGLGARFLYQPCPVLLRFAQGCLTVALGLLQTGGIADRNICSLGSLNAPPVAVV